MVGTYAIPRDHAFLMVMLPIISFFSGLFALYTMYLPPLFPTLLRTTGAGFCYNIGRIVAACGTVCFGLLSSVGDYRIALLAAGFLFLPAGLLGFLSSRSRGRAEPREVGGVENASAEPTAPRRISPSRPEAEPVISRQPVLLCSVRLDSTD